ncbi:HAMP domain-containing protein [Achromobacter sp. GG226]|uniref:methyl-accepting chemotaxis protein n=1 Tax=Verticiella alkaliphila TaxID=2779529 RepID=UPI001C0DCE23|nr:methyl-accepting chemotaxis protein [Verticiella sp. GG226]MBU4610521.1 HAMP domain-containing protein [Verticiella sp. GG226]
MLKKMKVSTLLLLVLLLLGGMIAVGSAIGGLGVRAGNEALHALDVVHGQGEGRLTAATLYAVRGGAVLRGAAAQSPVPAAELQRAEPLIAQARSALAEARKAPLSEAGLALMRPAADALDGYLGAVTTLQTALQGGNATAIASGLASLGPAGTRLETARDAFVRYSDAEAQRLLDGAASRYTFVRASIVVALIFVVLLIIAMRWVLQRQVVRPLRDASQLCDRIAQGDLTSRIDVTSENEIGALLGALQRMQRGLASTVSSVRLGVEQISTGARQIAAGNADLSTRTEQQAGALQATTSNMESLAAAVRQNADHARQATQLASGASDVAASGGEAVGQVVTTMREIASSSQKVEEIVGVIDSIAFQTNILALNAAVEAARAGEQGKGFAVVAGEVRSLAQRSAHAAKEIKDLIAESTRKVGEGSQQVERAGTTMQDIVQSVRRVSDLINEISSASVEQSGGIESVNRAVADMDDMTQHNAALVEQAAAAAASLEAQTRALDVAVAAFRLEGRAGAGITIDAEAPAAGAALSRATQVALPRTEAPAEPAPAPVTRRASALAPPAAKPAATRTARAAAPSATRTVAARAATRPATGTAAASNAGTIVKTPNRPAASAAPAVEPAPVRAAARPAARQAPSDDDWESF